MQNGSDGSTNGVAISLATAATAGAVSLLPQLTQWFQFGAAVLAFIAAAVGLWKALKK
jgi:membrane protein implicated in regulation of membrane protease activity